MTGLGSIASSSTSSDAKLAVASPPFYPNVPREKALELFELEHIEENIYRYSFISAH